MPEELLVTEWTVITDMKRRRAFRLGYYIREGISSIFTHGFMSFASVIIIVACLLIMGSFTLLALNVDNIIDRLEKEDVIIAYVDDSLSESEARDLQTELESIINVDHVEFMSREDAMEDFINTYKDTTFLEGLDATVLRHRYVVYVEDIALMEQTQDLIKNTIGIGGVSLHLEISEGFVALRNTVTIVSVFLVLILFIISLFIMSNTIKLTTIERKDEIAIMKMVGATSSFIRWPFIIEGMILGFVGSLSSYLAQWGVYKLLIDGPLSGSGLSFLTVLPFSTFAVPLLIAFCVVGLGVGVIGSASAIKNYLKV